MYENKEESDHDGDLVNDEELLFDQHEKKKKRRGPGRPKREVVPKVNKEPKETKKSGGRTRGPRK